MPSFNLKNLTNSLNCVCGSNSKVSRDHSKKKASIERLNEREMKKSGLEVFNIQGLKIFFVSLSVGNFLECWSNWC